MENETDIIKEYVQSLSQEMRNYFVGSSWSNKLTLISQVARLNDEQTSDLKTEIMLILIGMQRHSDLAENIKKNVLGISNENTERIANDIENNIFLEIKPQLEEMQKNITDLTQETDETLSKEKVLNDIENPVETKPIVPIKVNPAGQNPILDAQHNLPEGEKKVMISSAAVPSRGPMLNNFKSNFGTNAIPSVAPVIPATPVKPVVPVTPVNLVTPVTPPSTNSGPIIRTSSNRYAPPAPKKYGTDPYREPAE